jgi:hypothetical protein
MGQFSWFWPVWSENQKQQREDAKRIFKFARSGWKRLDRKMGAPDTHAWLVRGQSRNVQEKSARAQQRRGDRTEQIKKFLHAHPCCWPNSKKKTVRAWTLEHSGYCMAPWHFACKLRPDSDKKKSARAWRTGQGKVEKLLHAQQKKKKILRAPQGKWPDADEMTGYAGCDRIKKSGALSGSKKEKKTLSARQGKWSDKAKVSACTPLLTGLCKKRILARTGPAERLQAKKKKQKKYTARAAGGGSDRTGALTDAAERQQVKRKKYARPAEEKTGQKKVLCALHKATKKKSARQTLLQLTDLREQACAVRPGRDRFNRF